MMRVLSSRTDSTVLLRSMGSENPKSSVRSRVFLAEVTTSISPFSSMDCISSQVLS